MPARGGCLCIASGQLWLAGIPRHVSEAKLRDQCAAYGHLQHLEFVACADHDQALLIFATIGCGGLPGYSTLRMHSIMSGIHIMALRQPARVCPASFITSVPSVGSILLTMCPCALAGRRCHATRLCATRRSLAPLPWRCSFVQPHHSAIRHPGEHHTQPILL